MGRWTTLVGTPQEVKQLAARIRVKEVKEAKESRSAALDVLKLGVILGVAIIIAILIARDRYTVMSGRGGSVYVVNRFTGETKFCTPFECRLLVKK